MKKSGRKAVILILISLLVANRYVEYGISMQIDRGKNELISENGVVVKTKSEDGEKEIHGETEIESGTESETEAETETGDETKKEAEAETEIEVKKETNPETEIGVKEETNPETETRVKKETNPETETEVKDETNHGTEVGVKEETNFETESGEKEETNLETADDEIPQFSLELEHYEESAVVLEEGIYEGEWEEPGVVLQGNGVSGETATGALLDEGEGIYGEVWEEQENGIGENDNMLENEGEWAKKYISESGEEWGTEFVPENKEEWLTEYETDFMAESGMEWWTDTIPEDEADLMAEWDMEYLTEDGTEWESEYILEERTEWEPEYTPENETEWEPEYIPENETEWEPESISENETEWKPEYIPENETEWESESISEKETEPETEYITEAAENQEKVLHITDIQTILPDTGRIYDGTDQIKLSYQLDDEALRDEIRCEAHLSGSDAGTQEVFYHFELSEAAIEQGYTLEIEEVQLQVEILPKPLSVTMPDGWRIYGSSPRQEELHLLGSVKVSGFVQDENGKEVIPEDFKLPEAVLDETAVTQWDAMYAQGKQVIYQNAIIMGRTEDGTLTGNATSNYRFVSDPQDERYKRGSVTVEPGAISYGKDFTVKGEAGGLYQGEDTTLWVRRGTSICAEPLSASGYNCEVVSDGLLEDGCWEFTLKNKENGQITAASLPAKIGYRVDGMAPQAIIDAAGDVQENGTIYAKDSCSITISIPEDGQSGIKSAEYFVSASRENMDGAPGGEEAGWQDCKAGKTLLLQENGTYVIYVKTMDQVGNCAYSKSGQVVIDAEAPSLEIEGAEDGSANGGEVRLRVSCKDSFYKSGTLQVELSGANGAAAPAQAERKEEEQGAWIQYADFPTEKRADDYYTVKASAEDLAGNRTEKEIHFSVNRFGSVYALEAATQKEVDSFYHKEPFPVTFLETNLDYVGETQLLCRKDGTVTVLMPETDYAVELSENAGKWKQYRYTVPAETFNKEGIYELVLLSRDQAENTADSQSQKIEVQFAIDHTAPECLITGLSDQGIYHLPELWIGLDPKDNGQWKEMHLYLNGEEECCFKSNGDGKEFGRGGVIKWKIQEQSYWQRLQVYIEDEAGNGFWTKEIPFFVTTEIEDADIPDYEKTEKSARERKEEDERRKGVTLAENDMAKRTEAQPQAEEQQVQKQSFLAGGRRAVRLAKQFLQNEDMVRKGIFGICILTAIFLVLTASAWYLSRKR